MSSTQLKPFAPLERSTAVAIAALTTLGVWWLHFGGLDALLAVAGYSVQDWIFVSSRQWPAPAFPNGAANLGASLPLHLFRLAHEWLAIDPRALMPAFMLLEVALMTLAYVRFARVGAPRMAWIGVVVYALVIAFSQVQSLNLARFGHPFPWALYYALGEAFRLLAITAALGGHWRGAVAFIVAAGVTHPLIALPGFLSLGLVWMLTPERPDWRRLAPTAVIGAALLAGWTLSRIGGAGVAGGGIPTEEWLALTRMGNSHWHPVDNGLFTVLAERQLLPLLGLAGAAVAAWPTAPLDHRRPLGAIILATAGIAAVGVVVSALDVSPFWIKLALHRFSELTIAVVALPVVAVLWQDISAGRLHVRPVAALLLLSPLLAKMHAGFPLLIVAVWIIAARLQGGRRERRWAIAGLAVVCGSAIWAVASGAAIWADRSVSGWLYLRTMPWTAMALLGGGVAGAMLPWPARRAIVVAGFVAVMLLGSMKARLDERRSPRNDAAMAMMRWADQHLPPQAVVYTEPSASMGWRDVARRPSYGTARDWLHDSWLYDSRSETYAEGRRRFAELGLDLEPYLAIPNTGWQAAQRLRADVQRAYYGQPATWFADLADRRGVYAFVVDRQRVNPGMGLRPIYENDYWAISVPADELSR